MLIADDFRSDHQFEYRPEEPWDSEFNRRAAYGQWILFQCPLITFYDEDDPLTSYVMLVRDEAATPDLPRDAVLIVESVECGIECGEPRDIALETVLSAESPFGVGLLNSHHPYVVKALRVDGVVINIPKDIAEDDLRRLIEGSR